MIQDDSKYLKTNESIMPSSVGFRAKELCEESELYLQNAITEIHISLSSLSSHDYHSTITLFRNDRSQSLDMNEL